MAFQRHAGADDDVDDINLRHKDQRQQFVNWIQDRANQTGVAEIKACATKYTTAIETVYTNNNRNGNSTNKRIRTANNHPYFPQNEGYWFKIRWHHLWFKGTDVHTALFVEGLSDLRLPRSSRWAALVATSRRGGQPGSLAADFEEILEVARHRNYLCHMANHFFLLDTPTKEAEVIRVEEAALDVCNRIIKLILPDIKNGARNPKAPYLN
jgi:hypothetical protein